MNANAQRFEYRKGESTWIFIVHESDIVQVEARIGSLRTRRFDTDGADARLRIAALRADGYKSRFRAVTQSNNRLDSCGGACYTVGGGKEMRLGRDTNSVTNWMLSGTNGEPTPEVGMGITLLHWTDRSAATITRVSASGKTFWFKGDKTTRVDGNGMSEAQEYRYEPNPDALERRAVLTKRGWKEVRGPRIRLGERRAYHDYSF